MALVKICGVTSVACAWACVENGASAIGLHFDEASPARVSISLAREVSRAVSGRVLLVGVTTGLTREVLVALRADAGLGCLELGSDAISDATFQALLPHAYRAVRIRTPDDLTRAEQLGGDYLMVDVADSCLWTRLRPLAARTKLTLGGGLTLENLTEAVARVDPYCVNLDLAAACSDAPLKKDPAKIASLVRAAQSRSG